MQMADEVKKGKEANEKENSPKLENITKVLGLRPITIAGENGSKKRLEALVLCKDKRFYFIPTEEFKRGLPMYGQVS